MICSLSEQQQKGILVATREIIKKEPTAPTEDILKKVYDIGYHTLLKAGNPKAEEYGIAFVQFVAESLHTIAQEEKSANVLAQFGVDLNNDATSNALVYTHPNEVKKLVGIKETMKLKRNITKFSEAEQADLDNILAKLKLSFPKLGPARLFAKKQLSGGRIVDAVQLRVMEGDQPLFHVSLFSKNEDPRVSIPSVKNGYLIPEGAGFSEALTFGNMTDYALRVIFRNQGLSFSEVKELLKVDENLVKTFSAYSLGKSKPEETPENSGTFKAYFDQFINDMLVVASRIETQYAGYHITDLSDIIQNSALTQEEKDAFYIYSKSLGLIGELDLIAINPNGTFRVIDIKTSKEALSETTLSYYNTQVSAYTHIIAEATGLKPEGIADIFHVQKSYRKVMDEIKENDPTNRRRVVVTDIQAITSPILSRAELEEKAEKYRKERLASYTIVDNVEDEPKKAFKLLNPLEAIRRSNQAKKSKPLNQVISEQEPLNTRESIKQQAEWLETIFPELKGNGIQIVPSLMSNTGGQFFLDMIILAEKSNQGVGYHEGWHRFSQLYLTKQEKITLYEETRKLGIKYTDREGNKLNTKSSSFLQLEEFLAEEFRKYALNPSGYKFPSKEVTGIFAKIWEFLKSLLNYFKNGGMNSYEKLFKDLHDGNFYKGNYNINNAIFSTLNSFYRNSRKGGEQVLPNTVFLKYRDFADGYLTEYMLQNGSLITQFLNQEGIAKLTKVLHEGFTTLKEIAEEKLAEDVSITELTDTLGNMDKILGSNPKDTTFDDFMRAYLKTTNFDTLRKYIGANTELSSKIIEEQVLNPKEKSEVEGEEHKDNSTQSSDGEYAQFNTSGNEKPAMDMGSDIVKDFFNGIPELTISGKIPEGSTYEDFMLSSANGLPVYMNKAKAYYKTLEILEGHFTWDLIEKEMNTTENYEKFPELQIIKERLFGENGIITQLNAITEELKNGNLEGDALYERLQEQRKLKEFKNQFQHVMTLAKVRFETVVLNMQNPIDDNLLLEGTASTKKLNPVQTRENSESILTSIINDFTFGFQQQARKSQEDRLKQGMGPYMDLFDAFHTMLTDSKAADSLKKQKYFYDPVMKQFHLNPFYITHHFPKGVFQDEFNMASVKELLELYGIKLNPRAYENSEADIRKAFASLKVVSDAYQQHVQMIGANLAAPVRFGKSWVSKIKDLQQNKKDLAQLLAADKVNPEEISNLEAQIFEQQRGIRFVASKVFTTRPIDELLYRDETSIQDRTARKDDYTKFFALGLPTFIQLAKVQREYKDYFSSGSMLVADGTQYSYFLPNQMLLITKLIKYDVKSFDDFDKHPELMHLNPKRNPQYRNSWVFQQLFNMETGVRNPNIHFDISVLSQIAINQEDGTKEEKKFSEMTNDEKLLTDIIIVPREGSAEMRRMETSDTAYRMAVVNKVDGKHQFIKAVTIGNRNFKDHDFQKIIRGYLLSAITNYVYDITKEETKKRASKASLSIFEEMLGKDVSDSIKNRVRAQLKADPNYNWNNFFEDIFPETPFDINKDDMEFLNSIHDAIDNYFEGITITNSDSILNILPSVLSDKSKSTLLTLANDFKGKTVNGDIIPSTRMHTNFSGLHADEKFQRHIRDFIANDFIMAMEDSMLLFGDYSYYKDPIKRRKIIGNNGHLGITDVTDAEIEKIQVEKGGLLSVYRQAKGLPEDTGKDFRLVRKSIIADIKAQSKLITSGSLLADLREFYKQTEGKILSDEEILKRKANVFSAFSEMELGEGGAYVSLDLYRKMRQKADNWNDRDEAEFDRQKLIMAQKLMKKGESLSQEELEYINNGPYNDGFNIAKFALTGPVYSKESGPLKPTFDKMGLKPMLPETDWDTKRHLFEYMMDNSIDYVVYDSGSKGYQTEVHEAWDKNTFAPKKSSFTYGEHAGGFLKLQQNTAHVKEDSNLAVQLRGTFFSIMILQKEKTGKIDPKLQTLYNDFLNALRQHVQLMGEKELASIGLDPTGNFLKNEAGFPIGKKIFVEKIREKLIQIGSTDLSILDNLNVDKNGDFVNFLESLPLHREIYNIVSGILDDGLRKVRLNGSKMYQTMELGSGKLKPESKRKVIYAAPTSGKTTMFESGANVIDFDTFAAKAVRESRDKRPNETMQQFKARQSRGLKDIYDSEWKRALETGKTILVSQHYILDKFKDDIDEIYLVDKQEFRKRLEKRYSLKEEHFEDWYNNILKAASGKKITKTLGKDEYINQFVKPTLSNENKGTIGLNWHGLIYDNNGKIIGVSPVECKIGFKKNFHPLLNVAHTDGKPIGNLKRLNEMVKDEEWLKSNREKITMVGIRIPLQDLNFTSHMIIKEFLPEVEGDTIIVPPEFYKQVGSDNDIDTITTSFKYLDKKTGEVIQKPTETLKELNAKIAKLQEAVKGERKQILTPNTTEIINRVAAVRERILQENIFANFGKSTFDLDEELDLVSEGGLVSFTGLTKRGYVLWTLTKDSLHQDILDELNSIEADLNDNETEETFMEEKVKELKALKRKRANYTKGLTNSIISPVISFLEHPLSFDYVTETDSIAPVEELAKEVIEIREGRKVAKLNEEMSPLKSLSYGMNLKNTENNSQVRTMLGSFVKFSRLFTTLVQLDTSINQKYISGSIDKLAEVQGKLTDEIKLPKGFYKRTIWSPLLQKDVSGALKLSLYDENGDRITKNLSMVSSSLLDLFKNVETFPSLNISWNNIKPLLFLMAQGVPFNKAVKFLNNPITQMIEENRTQLGSAYQLRHAIMKTSKDTFSNDLHGEDYYYQENGQPNQMQKRHARVSQEYLEDKYKDNPNLFKVDSAQVENFMREFNEYRRTNGNKQSNDLKNFLAKTENAQYRDLAKDLMAYYSTLVEDGDHFYQMVIKKLDRDAVKYNNKAQIADSQKSERALTASGFLNANFLDKVKTESVFAPFYNDNIIRNVINSIMPEFYDKGIPGWIDGIDGLISKITSELYATSETKRRVESKIIADLMDAIIKNFHVVKWTNQNGETIHNFPYEFFEQDIIPELSLEHIRRIMYGEDGNVKGDNESFDNLKTKMGDQNTEFLSGYTLFANQFDLLRAKYPELLELEIVKVLQPRRTTPHLEYTPIEREESEFGDDLEGFMEEEQKKKTKEREITMSERFNALSQVYLNMNLSTDPQTKFVDEQKVRDEWDKLVNFQMSTFSHIFDKITASKEREKFYRNPQNIEEIRSIFKLLIPYSLVQNSHLDRATGSFAYLAPVSELKGIVEDALTNFKKVAKGWSQKDTLRFLETFEQAFREMNPDIALKIPRGGVGYRKEKVKSGKLYSKATMGNETIAIAKQALLKKSPGKLGHNQFIINNEPKENDQFSKDCI